MNLPLRHLPSSSRRSAGMTLVEVLVTLVIISIGLLGVAALQLTTVRNNYDAFVRTQAATLAGDMLDRMRANRSRVMDYRIAIDNTTVPENTAGTDITRWRTTLADQLPMGIGGIAYDQVTRIVTISIQWRERVDSDDPDDRTLTFTTSSQI